MRAFSLWASALGLSVLLAAGCVAPAAEAPMAEAPDAMESDGKYAQSPYLDEQVASGALAPVEERLPVNPLVVVPGIVSEVDDLPELQIGEYGGVMRFAHPTPNWNPDVFIMLNENVLGAPGIGVSGIYGNVVESYEVNDDNTVFTFQLREGLKWSDGEPVTTADVRFAYEDVLLNETLTLSMPSKFRGGGHPTGAPMNLEILDDYAFRIAFDASYGGFLRELSIKGWQGYTDLFKPAHHLKAVHSGYADADAIQSMMEERGLDSEQALFAAVDCENWHIPRQKCNGFPALWPWMNVTESEDFMKFVRNPYYFKVDAAGNQLPYVDEVVSALVGDTDGVNLKVFADEVDMLREDTALLKLPLYQEAKEKGYINFVLLDNHVDPTALFLNLTHEDPVWQEVVGNVEFRRALNMAINREQIIESIYYGFGALPELVPGEFNPERAREMLDAIGLDQRDSDGWRMGPDGNTFTIPIEHADHAPDIGPVAELLTEYFRDVGLNTTLKKIEPSLWNQRRNAGELYATLIWSVQPMWKNGTWTDYLPTNTWAPEWTTWMNSDGENGMEPPAPVKRIIELHQGRVSAIPSSPEDEALTEELYRIHYDNVYVFNIAEKVRYVLVTDAAMRNVPVAGQAIAGNNSGEQMYYASNP